jgi:hypothetical protein
MSLVEGVVFEARNHHNLGQHTYLILSRLSEQRSSTEVPVFSWEGEKSTHSCLEIIIGDCIKLDKKESIKTDDGVRRE